MTDDEAVDVIAILQAAYPGRELPDPSVRLYAQELLPFERGDAVSAIRWLMRTSPFLPALSEILSECQDARQIRLDRERPQRPALTTGDKELTPEERERGMEVLRTFRSKFGKHKHDSHWHKVKRVPVGEIPVDEAEVAKKRARAEELKNA